jgi:hypothetical protein
MKTRTRRQQANVKANKLNNIIHNRNLYFKRDGDGAYIRVINAHVESGTDKVVVECLHSGAVVEVEGKTLKDGSNNEVKFTEL